jgi:hypothetical protein
MTDVYKIESKEDLIQKINEELDVLESIFDGEGVILKKAEEVTCSEVDVSTSGSGSQDDIDSPLSQFMVQIELDLKPNTGMDNAKVGLLAQVRMIFDQFYPYRAPKI